MDPRERERPGTKRLNQLHRSTRSRGFWIRLAVSVGLALVGVPLVDLPL